MNFKHRLPSTGHGIDFIVYRPAGGAGQHESQRLRLGGKQMPAGCDQINTRIAWMGATSGNQKNSNTGRPFLLIPKSFVAKGGYSVFSCANQSGWLTHFAA